jgi:rare lipoprotein A
MGATERLMVGRFTRVGAAVSALLALVACSSSDPVRTIASSSPISPPPVSVRIADEGEPIRKGQGSYKVGQPYTINGQTHVPATDPKYRAEGIASWYGPDFHGKETANGEIYDMQGISAAHKTMPMPSYARVTNLENGRSIVVRVNDRGPFIDDRIIDLSVGTARALDTYARGLARVRVEYVGRAPLQGSDDKMLLATLRVGRPAPAPSLVMVASAKPMTVSMDAGNQGTVGARKSTSSGGVGGPFVLSSAASRPVSQSPWPEGATDRRMRSLSGPDPDPTSGQPNGWSQGQSPGVLPPRTESLGISGGRGLY